MEVSHIISVLVFLVIVTVPIWMLVRSGNKKKKALMDRANKLRVENYINFTESDTWDNLVLGLDSTTKKLLWFKDSDSGGTHQLVDLRTIAQCKKINVGRSVNAGKTSSQVLDQLGLELLPKEGKGTPLLLEFYNSNNSYLFSTQLELQGKWHKLIAESLEN